LHYVDTLLSVSESHLYGIKQENPMQLLVLDDKTMEKIKSEMENKGQVD
jgi:hypothetical protein